MNLRSATHSDAEAIAELWQQSIRTLCSSHYSPSVIAEWSAGKTPHEVRLLILCEHLFLVAVQDAQIMGFACATFEIGTFALYVSPAFAKRGAGSRLLNAVERIARAEGLHVFSFCSSLNAVDFYKKHGYTTGARITASDGRDGIEVFKKLT